MLIRFEPSGKIVHIKSDPETQGMIDAIVAEGDWLREAGYQLPPIPFFTPNGDPILDDKGEQIIASPGMQTPIVQLHSHYVTDATDPELRKVVDRPVANATDATIKADGIDTFTINDLPTPCAFLLDGERIDIVDGILEFLTNDAGTYVFETVFPFVEAKFTVTAI
jgi:hypothetical protein